MILGCFALGLSIILHSQKYIQHVAGESNTSNECTIIDSDETNNRPDVILVITKIANLKKDQETPVFGVEYTSGQWYIFNKNNYPIAPNTTFILAVNEVPDDNMFTLSCIITDSIEIIPITNELIYTLTKPKIFFTEKKDGYTTRNNSEAELRYIKGKWFIKCKGGITKEVIYKFNVLISPIQKRQEKESARTKRDILLASGLKLIVDT